MGYLSLGILVITFSISVYTYTASKHPRAFPIWRGKGTLKGAAAESQGVGKREDDSQMQDNMPTITFDEGEDEASQKTSTPEQTPGTIPKFDIEPPASSQPCTSQEQGMMPPPLHTTRNAARDSGQQAASLMPPPSRPGPPPNTFKSPPKPSTALRPPPSAASTLRAPAASSLKPSTSSLAPSISTLAPSARPSKKVLLDPGHSPLDWAHLTANPPTATFLRGADVPPNLIRVPPSALRYHTGRKGKDAWGVYQGKVYNLTPYMKFHPGGVDQLMRGAGKEKEGEKLFNEIHPWVSWENMLGECLIGILVSENEAQTIVGKEESKMDEMD